MAAGAELTEKDVQRAYVETTEGSPVIHIVLTPDGAEKFAKLTAAHIDEPLAMLVDGKVLSAPIIKAQIKGGRLRLTGRFTVDEAVRIAAGLNKS